MTVFWRHGYDPTSIAMLTDAMGIGAPSLYATFGDKRRLFFEALDRYLHTHAAFTAAVIADEPSARAAVRRLLLEAATAYTTAGRPRGCLLITATTNCSPQSGDVGNRLRKLRAASTRQLEAKLAAAAAGGELPRGTDTRALARFYGATLAGMSAQARDGATTEELVGIAEIALAAWPG